MRRFDSIEVSRDAEAERGSHIMKE